MSIWYEVEKTENGIQNFMECNWGFHDFYLDRVSYLPAKKLIELFLKYDELEGSIMLRFVGVHDYHFRIHEDQYDCLILDATMILVDNGSIFWCDCEALSTIEELKSHSDWIEADSVIWAVTNSLGIPDEMPDDKINQVWHNVDVMNNREVTKEKHFQLKPFQGNQDLIE